ncbi:helix-turn-helix transcriptional regulator [Fimbriimonas ginsengisoli]|uniref:Transcriptional regulator padr family protein n=1 Tax=Fimbriimonas ginsengisoli Gsoil 348 TaxID=661478 RepID=A0A068NXZ7_FIMGI|nr:helix-turn-helix transcriptional regulator [Fimbriimonas ginsengisoli]AIE87700.1 transcriptional regulator padr family protein [Fimbriimonas ginsengisoli Gsoil 348]
MIGNRAPSTLELIVLGVLHKKGPCIAHAVLVEFSGSSTHAYRSGAGAIYPLLKRLTDAGLVQMEGRLFSLTETGLTVLRNWVTPPFAEADFSTSVDLLRARMYFLRLLSPVEIADFLTAAEEGLRRLRQEAEATFENYVRSGDRYSQLAMRGALLETDARLQWIDEVRQSLTVDNQNLGSAGH